jgi:hypothetical protein
VSGAGADDAGFVARGGDAGCPAATGFLSILRLAGGDSLPFLGAAGAGIASGDAILRIIE